MENKLLFSFSVAGQIISRQDNLIPVGKCRNVYRARFKFQGDIWEGEKTALFRMGDTTKAAVLDANDECDVPWEFFDTEGTAYGKVSVFCGDLVTANETSVLIMQSGYTKSDASVPPTPDVYQQIMDIVGDTKKIAQSVRDDAKAGKFNGIDGDSAYEIAVQFGFAGTEEEWLESLRYDHSDEFLAMAENVRKAIESEGVIQAKKVTDAGSEQIKLVNTTGSEQTSAISAEGKKQLEAVNKATAEIVADREQINQNKKDIERLDCSKSDAIVDSESGEVITLSDSDDESFLKLTIFGRSVQDGVPSQTNPVSIQSAGDKGSINIDVTGKNLWSLGDVSFNTYKELSINYPAGDYVLSCDIKTEADSPTVQVGINIDGSWKYSQIKKGNRAIIKISCTTGVTAVRFYAGSSLAYNVNAIYYDILIEKGIEATNYEPYKQPQSLVLQTPNGLLGIKVKSDGNYTDSTGQQWICDSIDLAKGKYVQRIKKKIFDGTEQLVDNIGNKTSFLFQTSTGGDGLCNCGKIISPDTEEQAELSCSVSKLGIYLYTTKTVDTFKKELAQKYESGNPVYVIYTLSAPIETDLPAETIAAFKSLHTNYPVTIVSNDAWAEMELEYTVDTKTYIDTKIAEVSTAIVQKGI